PVDEVPPPKLAWPAPESTREPDGEPEEEVSFIEVGGPRSTIVASPDVLASAAKAPARPAPAPGPRLRPIFGATPAEAPARVMPAGSRPLPAAPAPLGPAHRRFAPELIAFHRSEHPVSEQYRVLADDLTAQLPGGRSQVLLFTALTSEVGTTT